MDIYQVTTDDLDLNAIVRQLTLPTTGAVVTFVGAVRERDPGKQVAQLYYEAYTPMAEAKLRQVAAEMRERFPNIESVALIQRVGLLEAGTPTIIVAVSSPHRDQGCFEAARYGIDRIKEIVPVWKKEIGANGETWIEGHYQPEEQE
jgi:molybdopterin synthase catalytic subunit